MTRPRRDKTCQVWTEQQFEVTLEGLDHLDAAVTQHELSLIELYFQDILQELEQKGGPQ